MNTNDPFRKAYRELSEAEKSRLDRIKTLAGQLHAELVPTHAEYRPGDHQPTPIGARELAVSRTKLEECVMWAVKGITG